LNNLKKEYKATALKIINKEITNEIAKFGKGGRCGVCGNKNIGKGTERRLVGDMAINK
jgi:hypothetical protein